RQPRRHRRRAGAGHGAGPGARPRHRHRGGDRPPGVRRQRLRVRGEPQVAPVRAARAPPPRRPGPPAPRGAPPPPRPVTPGAPPPRLAARGAAPAEGPGILPRGTMTEQQGQAAEGPITPRATDFAQWYQDVVAAAELLDQAPVRGCWILRPNGYTIWETCQRE